jgi:hypothetical protein
MQRILAWALVIALINVITLCPLLAAGMPVSSSCCPHSKGPSLPCTESTGRNCPYVLLEKAKAESGLAAIHLAAVPVSVAAELHPADWFSTPFVPPFFKDSTGSYLRNRVLRI